ncbi:DUF1778 domain-containing protein [Xanthomonas translucens pv. undulosa]
MTTAAARLDLRLNPTDKARITRAANLRGVPLSAFVRDAVLREAESVMAAELTFTLSAEESRRFLKALDAPLPAQCQAEESPRPRRAGLIRAGCRATQAQAAQPRRIQVW